MARGKKPTHELDPIVALLQKKFGSTSAQRLGDGQEMEAESQVKEVIPCGVDVIDRYLFELGGYAVPRMTEVYGSEGCGKTSLVYQSIATAQRNGCKCALIDAEFSFDAVRAKQLGVDIGNLILCTPEHMEMGIEQMKLILTNHDASKRALLLAWDSIASMNTKAGISCAAGERSVGEVPRIMSEELKKLLALCKDHRAHLLATNQIRAKIGVMFGPNTTTPGGYAPKFYSSVRLEFFGGKAIKDPKTGRHTGKILTLVLQKSRFSEPFRKARVRFDYATGWNNEWSTLEHAKEMGVLKGRGPKGVAPKGAKAYAEAIRKLGWGDIQPVSKDESVKATDSDGEEEE